MNTPISFSIEEVRDYILDKLKNNKEFFFFNELELQIFVARELEKVFKAGYKVHLEYQLPKGWNPIFDEGYQRWGTEKPYFDIVIEHENQFIAIELKYKLKKIRLRPEERFLRFGEKANDRNLILVTNQSAENEGRYDFWKDVKRIEILSKAFDNVIGGIAILVTNQENYKNSNENFKYSNFNLSDSKNGFLYWNIKNEQVREGIPSGEKLKDNKSQKTNWGQEWEHWVRPNFTLEGEYKDLEWSNYEGPLKENFYFYSVVIPKYSK